MKRRIATRLVPVGLVALLVAGAVTSSAEARTPAPNSLQITQAFKLGKRLVTLPHRPVLVQVKLPAYAARGTVEFTAAIGLHVFKRVKLHRSPKATGTWRLKESVAAPRPGVVTIILRTIGEPVGRTAGRRAGVKYKLRERFTALTATYTPGATGPFIELMQQQLAALHLYIPRSGVYDNGTELALDAYHRLLGEGEGHMTLNPMTVTDLLDEKGTFHVRYPQQGPHAEGDLSDQVLAFTDGSKVHWLFPISSGKPSTPTILGNFQVYRKQPEYTSDGMYFSDFFTGGYAIHGYNPAPDYPASHGCMRLPMVDAVPAYNWLQLGDWVDTYYT
jgi:hypothetical protein